MKGIKKKERLITIITNILRGTEEKELTIDELVARTGYTRHYLLTILRYLAQEEQKQNIKLPFLYIPGNRSNPTRIVLREKQRSTAEERIT